jgi:hypothetical protein
MPSSTVTGNKRAIHTRLIMRNISSYFFFVKLYSIINKNSFFFLELLLFFSKAVWVAVDCRSKNWVAVLKSLGSTGLEPYHYASLFARRYGIDLPRLSND